MKINTHHSETIRCSIFNNYLKLVDEIEQSKTLEPLEQSKLKTLKKLLKEHRCKDSTHKISTVLIDPAELRG